MCSNRLCRPGQRTLRRYVPPERAAERFCRDETSIGLGCPRGEPRLSPREQSMTNWEGRDPVANTGGKHPEVVGEQADLAKEAGVGEVCHHGEALPREPASPEPWPEDFWKAFEGMPDEFERPGQSGKDPEGQPREAWVECGPSEEDCHEEDREETDALP